MSKRTINTTDTDIARMNASKDHVYPKNKKDIWLFFIYDVIMCDATAIICLTMETLLNRVDKAI